MTLEFLRRGYPLRDFSPYFVRPVNLASIQPQPPIDTLVVAEYL